MTNVKLFVCPEDNRLLELLVPKSMTVGEFKRLLSKEHSCGPESTLLLILNRELLQDDRTTLRQLDVIDGTYILLFRDYQKPPNKLFIQFVHSKVTTTEIEFTPQLTVNSIKQHMIEKSHELQSVTSHRRLTADDLILRLNTTTLDQNYSLSLIPPGSTLSLFVNESSQIQIEVSCIHKTLSLQIAYNDNVSTIRKKVAESFKDDPQAPAPYKSLTDSSIALIFKGQLLDDLPITTYHISSGSRLFFISRTNKFYAIKYIIKPQKLPEPPPFFPSYLPNSLSHTALLCTTSGLQFPLFFGIDPNVVILHHTANIAALISGRSFYNILPLNTDQTSYNPAITDTGACTLSTFSQNRPLLLRYFLPPLGRIPVVFIYPSGQSVTVGIPESALSATSKYRAKQLIPLCLYHFPHVDPARVQLKLEARFLNLDQPLHEQGLSRQNNRITVVLTPLQQGQW